MALVDVEDARVDPERGERTHAADAEQELLADPVLAVAGIEGVGEQVHVEEIQRDGRDGRCRRRGAIPRRSTVSPASSTSTSTGSRTSPSAFGSSALYVSVWRPSAESPW